ncbi:hypothetical protein D3C76_1857690 [compost metagenome]
MLDKPIADVICEAADIIMNIIVGMLTSNVWLLKFFLIADDQYVNKFGISN